MRGIEKFRIAMNELIDDVKCGKLTLEQAHKRANQAGKLVPDNYLIETRYFNKLMKETYGNEPEWEKYYSTIVINVR